MLITNHFDITKCFLTSSFIYEFQFFDFVSSGNGGKSSKSHFRSSNVDWIGCNGSGRRRWRSRRTFVDEWQWMAAIVEEAPERKLVKSVRIFALLVLRVWIVIHQARRIDGIKVWCVRLVKNFWFPRSTLKPERFREVDSVEEGMPFDILRSGAISKSGRSVGAEASDEIFCLEWNESLRNVKSFSPTHDLKLIHLLFKNLFRFALLNLSKSLNPFMLTCQLNWRLWLISWNRNRANLNEKAKHLRKLLEKVELSKA